jgi:hypothetical protein
MIYEYYINLDERGEFRADVRKPSGETIFEIDGFDIFEDGFMCHANDMGGLADYLADLGIIKTTDRIVMSN